MFLLQPALVPLCPTCTVFYFPFCVLHCPFTLFPCSLPCLELVSLLLPCRPCPFAALLHCPPCCHCHALVP